MNNAHTVDQVLAAVKQANEGTMDAIRREYATLRTGRASVSVLDGIMIDYYGTATPLNQVAVLSAPQPRMITVKPYEKRLLGDIEKAIQTSDLGINPVNDGEMIKLPIPQLSEERRKEMVKTTKKHAEDFKVSVRGHRRDALERVKQLEKEKKISEDESKRGQEKVQKTTDEFIKKIEETQAAKEKELLEV